MLYALTCAGIMIILAGTTLGILKLKQKLKITDEKISALTSNVWLGILAIVLVIIGVGVLIYGLGDIYQGIRSFSVPGADPFGLIIKGLQTLLLIAVPAMYIQLRNKNKKNNGHS